MRRGAHQTQGAKSSRLEEREGRNAPKTEKEQGSEPWLGTKKRWPRKDVFVLAKQIP